MDRKHSGYAGKDSLICVLSFYKVEFCASKLLKNSCKRVMLCIPSFFIQRQQHIKHTRNLYHEQLQHVFEFSISLKFSKSHFAASVEFSTRLTSSLLNSQVTLILPLCWLPKICSMGLSTRMNHPEFLGV